MMMAAARVQREQMKIRGKKLGQVEAGPARRKYDCKTTEGTGNVRRNNNKEEETKILG